MKYILYLLLLISTSCIGQVHDYNIRIDYPKDPDSVYVLLTGNSGAFAGRGRFNSLPQLATVLQPFLSGGGGTWGSITGTLSNQTDLQNALDAKLSSEVDGSTTNEIQGIYNVLSQGEVFSNNGAFDVDVYNFSVLTNGTKRLFNVNSTGVVIGDIDNINGGNVLSVGSGYISQLDNFTHDSKLGINKNGSTPSEALDVIGNGQFSGTLSASNLSGTNTGDAINIFNDPVTANGTLNYQGYNITMTNIGNYSMSTGGDIVYGADGNLEIYGDEENTYLLLDATGAETATGGNIKLNSSGGNIELTTLDASNGSEDSWIVKDDATGKLYAKSLLATTATLGSGVTTYAITRNVTTLTGHASGNTLATLTGGISGQIITLIFADALITITDDASGTASTVNLSAAFTSTANDVLTLVHNGTSWRECSRSTN